MADRSDHLLAEDLAVGAGILLVRLRDRLRVLGVDERVAKDVGDLAAHQYLVDRLRAERPDDAILSEEDEAGDPSATDRLDADRVWIVDPLDGTREFGEGRDDWAVHVALVEDHVPTAGAVTLPARETVLSTASPPTLPRTDDGPLRIAVSRTRPPEIAESVAEQLGATLVPMGSAGVKVASVVLGLADVYLHAGGQKQWDNCAPVAVARSAGVVCTRLDGTPLRYNLAPLEIDDLLVCRPECESRVRAALGDGSRPDPAQG